MNAVSLACKRRPAVVGQNIRKRYTGSDVADAVIADRNVCDRADWANVGGGPRCLVLRSQQNGITHLAEASPTVFEYVAFDQHPFRVLQLEVVLHDERIA